MADTLDILVRMPAQVIKITGARQHNLKNESPSACVRQFCDQMKNPNVDFLRRLSPAIAIQQRSTKAKRWTIATTTENYHYLRILFRRASTARSAERPTRAMLCNHASAALNPA